MLSVAYENAIQALAELSTQKEKLNKIDISNKQITKNINYSKNLMLSINSFYKKIKKQIL